LNPPERKSDFVSDLTELFVIRRDSAEIVIGMWKLNGSQEFLFEHKQMAINSELPKKWSRGQQGFVVNDDWLLWDLKKDKKGAQVNFAPGENK
jgi:hypothetical protein